MVVGQRKPRSIHRPGRPHIAHTQTCVHHPNEPLNPTTIARDAISRLLIGDAARRARKAIWKLRRISVPDCVARLYSRASAGNECDPIFGLASALRFLQFGVSISNDAVLDLCDFRLVSWPAE
jgi:hypothetical protein